MAIEPCPTEAQSALGSTSRVPGVRRHFRSDLRNMLGDGIAFSLMVGLGEAYIAPFALALGFGDVAAGLIATVPMLAGAVLQLVTPAAVRWLGSHKRWVVLCAALQALTFVPLMVSALANDTSLTTIFVAATLYWALGMATSPAWNTWAAALVPPSLRATYFAHRSRWNNAALLGGLALGGESLRRGELAGRTLDAYAWVFLGALVARVISAGFLGRQSETKPVEIGHTRISPRAIRTHLRQGGHGRLLAYLLCFQLSVWCAAPFFTPYMLGPLGLDYAGFAILTGASFAARIAALPWLGRRAHVSGTRRLLWIGSAGIVPLPLLWLVSNDFAWLLALQLVSGIAWGAFELAGLLSFFEHIPLQSRTSILSVYNLANAAAIAVGSCIGAVLLTSIGDASSYAALFLLSSIARLLSLLLLRGVRDVVPVESRTLALRTLGLRPSSGAIQRPVLAGLSDLESGREDGESE
jgi:MFS family permease